jgi:hypothetical protein
MAQYTRFRKRLFANINQEPQNNMERISNRLQGTQRPDGAALQQKGMVQRESYMKGQKSERGFGITTPQAYPKPNPNTPLERMYQERQSRFGRNVRKNRFTGADQSTQQQIKYTQGTNALVRKQLERGEISQEAFQNRYSFMPNTYSVARARNKMRGK